MAKAFRHMVVDEPDGLHPGIDDDGADEFEAAGFQRGRQGAGLRRLGRDLAFVTPRVLDRLAADRAPDEGGEVLARVAHRQISARIADRRHDLGTGADDAGIREK